MKVKVQLLGALSVLMGLVYVFMPYIEVEARAWGALSVLAGVCAFSFVPYVEKNRNVQWFGVFGFFLLALAQWFPVEAWTFSPMMTDHVDALAERVLSENVHLGMLPHLILFALSLHLGMNFLKKLFKSKTEVLSVGMILAFTMGLWGLVWLSDFRVTFDSVMQENDPRLISMDIDHLEYQVRELAREVTEENVLWSLGEGGYRLSSEELGLRFFMPSTWLSGDPVDQGIRPKFTSFKNNVIQGQKWELDLGLVEVLAHKNFYPAQESFLYALNSADQDFAYFNLAYMEHESDSKMACESFLAMVLSSTECEQVKGLPMDVYQVDYATYTDVEFYAQFDGNDHEPLMVGGSIWFVSLEGLGSSYGGFWLHHQMLEEPLRDRALFYDQGLEGLAEEQLGLVLEQKDEAFDQEVQQFLSSVVEF